jgi:hypothetical protein
LVVVVAVVVALAVAATVAILENQPKEVSRLAVI